MASRSEACQPAWASAFFEASRARSVAPVPGLAQRRSRIPVRCWIHSSLVSIIVVSSWFVTTRSGTCVPSPTITVLAMAGGLLLRDRTIRRNAPRFQPPRALRRSRLPGLQRHWSASFFRRTRPCPLPGGGAGRRLLQHAGRGVVPERIRDLLGSERPAGRVPLGHPVHRAE